MDTFLNLLVPLAVLLLGIGSLVGKPATRQILIVIATILAGVACVLALIPALGG